MRILHTVALYDPRVGGAEKVVKEASERLVARGHEVTVATGYAPDRTFTERNGVRVESFRIEGNATLGIRGTDAKRYQEFILDSKFDVVMNYAAQSWATDLTYPLLRQLNSAKVLFACGYSGLVTWRKYIYAGYFRRMPAILADYDLVVYHSAIGRDYDFGEKHQIKHYRIVPNAICADEFDHDLDVSFRKQYNITTPHLLVTIGNHYKIKGHDYIIKAFNQLGRDDVTLAIIGNNTAKAHRSCYPSCQQASAENPNIRLFEGIPRTHVVAALKEADLFLLGSLIEAFPLVILESMGAGVPFVSTDAGNTRELPGGVIIYSPQEMSGAIRDLLQSPEKRAALALLGKTAQRQRYEWDAVIDQYEHVYQEAVALAAKNRGTRL